MKRLTRCTTCSLVAAALFASLAALSGEASRLAAQQPPAPPPPDAPAPTSAPAAHEPHELPARIRGEAARAMQIRALDEWMRSGNGDVGGTLSSLSAIHAVRAGGNETGPDAEAAQRLKIAAATLGGDDAAVRALIIAFAALEPNGATLNHRIPAMGALWSSLIAMQRLPLAAEAANALLKSLPDYRYAKKLIACSLLLEGKVMESSELVVALLDAPCEKGEYGFTYSYRFGEKELLGPAQFWASPSFRRDVYLNTQRVQRSGDEEFEVRYDLPDVEDLSIRIASDEALTKAVAAKAAAPSAATGWKYLNARVALEKALATAMAQPMKSAPASASADPAAPASSPPPGAETPAPPAPAAPPSDKPAEAPKPDLVQQALLAVEKSTGDDGDRAVSQTLLQWLKFRAALASSDPEMLLAELTAVLQTTRSAAADDAILAVLARTPPESYASLLGSITTMLKDSGQNSRDRTQSIAPFQAALVASLVTHRDTHADLFPKYLAAADEFLKHRPSALITGLGYPLAAVIEVIPEATDEAGARALLNSLNIARSELVGDPLSIAAGMHAGRDLAYGIRTQNQWRFLEACRQLGLLTSRPLESRSIAGAIRTVAKLMVSFTTDGGAALLTKEIETFRKNLKTFDDNVVKFNGTANTSPALFVTSARVAMRQRELISALLAAVDEKVRAAANPPKLDWRSLKWLPDPSEYGAVCSAASATPQAATAAADLIAVIPGIEALRDNASAAKDPDSSRWLLAPLETLAAATARELLEGASGDLPAAQRTALDDRLTRTQECGPALMFQLTTDFSAAVADQALVKRILVRFHRTELMAAARRDQASNIMARSQRTNAVATSPDWLRWSTYAGADSEHTFGYPARFFDFVPATDSARALFVQAAARARPFIASEQAMEPDDINEHVWGMHLIGEPDPASVRRMKYALAMGRVPDETLFDAQVRAANLETVAAPLDTYAWALFESGDVAGAIAAETFASQLEPGRDEYLRTVKLFKSKLSATPPQTPPSK